MMKTVKKVLSIVLSAIMLFSVVSVGFAFSASAVVCDHNIGEEFENSTMVIYSTVPATCVSTGTAYYECTNCDFTTKATIEIDPKSHTMGAWKTVEGKDAGCDTEGEKIRYCLNCGEEETASIPATGNHTYPEASLLDFWWTVEGIKVGSEYMGWKILEIPTCFSAGLAKTSCIDCKKAEITASLQLHSATFTEVEREDATCLKAGTSCVVCTECNANYTLTIPVDKNNHSLRWKVTTEATCTSEGEEAAYCVWHPDATDLGTRIIEKKSHSFTKYESDHNATCTADGTKTAKCDNCDAKDTVTDEGTKGYCLTKWIYTSGNCKDGGTAYIDCIYSNCEVEYVEVKNFEPGAHPNLTIRTVEPTCTTDGYRCAECADCGYFAQLPGSVIETTGHDYNWVNKIAGNCITKQDRVDIGTCTKCGNSEERTVPYEHNFETISPEVAATCTKDGKTAHLICGSCGEEVIPQELPSFGHNDPNGDGCCDTCYIYIVKNPDGETVDCSCLCHNSDGIAQFLFKIFSFFCRLFGINQSCECGAVHYEKAGLF